MIWFNSIDSTTISWNTCSRLRILLKLRESTMYNIVVHKFSLCFVRTDQWVSGQQCMEVRKAIIPPWNVTRMKRKLTLTMFWEITLTSKLLNQFHWYWYKFFSEDNVLSDEIKICYIIFVHIKVTKSKRSASLGTPSLPGTGICEFGLTNLRNNARTPGQRFMKLVSHWQLL